MSNLRTGTRIEVRGLALDWTEVWHPAKIARQPKGGYPVPGYWVVQYDDGGRLAAHESGFRVVSNR